MAYLPQFENDVYISYAHVDNSQFSTTTQGWVDDFHHYLEAELNRRSARGAVRIWRDFDRDETYFTESQRAIERSAIFVPLISNGYLSSDLCRNEGPREGYVLLEAVRAKDKTTPFFIYAGSRAVAHRREAALRGAQGTTNRAEELVELVTRALPGGSHNQTEIEVSVESAALRADDARSTNNAKNNYLVRCLFASCCCSPGSDK